MTDQDIRERLKRDLRSKYRDLDTIVVEELALSHGRTRVDVAVVNGVLHGYELKSDCDTLKRLARQTTIYNDVLDRATLVVGSRHLRHAAEVVPSWWGIAIACGEGSDVQISEIRAPGDNPAPRPMEIAKLLWRDEALELLREYGAAKGVVSKTRRIIYSRVADAIDLETLKRHVRSVLKSRQDWRPVQRHTSSDD